MIIKDVKIILPDREIEKGSIITENEFITAIQNTDTEYSGEIIDGSDLIAIPGLIDLHIHGAHGVSVTDDDSDSLNKLSKILVQFGITGFLWTTMAVPLKEIEDVMIQAGKFDNNNDGALCYGVNIEGSFISPGRAGSHLTSCIFEPEISLIEKWLDLSKNKIKIVTIAPEKTSKEFIQFLISKNIIPSIGHSNATYEQTLQALEYGAGYFTHLGNAMGIMHQREPGIIGAALLDNNSVAEIICDGVHVHPAVLQVFIKTKGWDKFVIVSDGTCVMGMPPGNYKWYDKNAIYDGKSLKLEDQTIAGGVIPLNKSLNNLVKFTGCTLSAAVRMTSLRPARMLGIDDKVGILSPGKIANIALIDKNYEVVHTIVNGKLVYSRT